MQSLNGVLWSDAANAALNTVQGAYKACSYGQASFSQKDGGKVLDTVVNIPCSGTTPGGNSYDSSQCPYVGKSNPCATSNGYVACMCVWFLGLGLRGSGLSCHAAVTITALMMQRKQCKPMTVYAGWLQLPCMQYFVMHGLEGLL